MAKLEAPVNAGWNAGRNYFAKAVKLDDIVIDPKISKVFKVDGKMCNEIKTKIEKEGYDKSQPIVIWKDKNILVDGHTRLSAAKALGLDEIPAVEMDFSDFEDAILYTFERQVIRRNLTPAEILTAASMIKERKYRDGKGRAAEQLAEKLGVSAATIYQAKKLIAEAPEEKLEEIKNGEKLISTAYREITEKPLVEKDEIMPSENKRVTEKKGFDKNQVYIKIMAARHCIETQELEKAISLLDEIGKMLYGNLATAGSEAGNALQV